MKGGRRRAVDNSFLVQLAASEDVPDFLTHMRLHKLLCYVQGWSLALRRTGRCCLEQIEAWADGPVVRDLYPRFADFGDRPITQRICWSRGDYRKMTGSSLSPFGKRTRSILGQASAMTHSESPWKDARGKCIRWIRCTNEITHPRPREGSSSRHPRAVTKVNTDA